MDEAAKAICGVEALRLRMSLYSWSSRCFTERELKPGDSDCIWIVDWICGSLSRSAWMYPKMSSLSASRTPIAMMRL